MKPAVTLAAAFGIAALAVAPAALGERKIVGADDDDDKPADAGPAKATPPASTPPASTPPAKKDDKKAPPPATTPATTPATPAKVDDKKASASTPAKADDKKKAPVDVLADTPDDKKAKDKAADAKDKAEQAADAATKKKEADQQKLVEEKKAADAKRKVENKDQRLASAKKIRVLSRQSGPISISLAIEPGYVQTNAMLEVRVDLSEKVDVPDPRYGNFVPERGLDLVATVSHGGQKTRYAVHVLDAPGRYGFHTTPLKDGSYLVSLEGNTKDGKPVSASFPLHVGVWPPPDFDDEEKNNSALDAAGGGRRVLGGE